MPRGDRAARRVDVEGDVLLRVLGGQQQQLRGDPVGDVVVDLLAEHDDPLPQQPLVHRVVQGHRRRRGAPTAMAPRAARRRVCCRVTSSPAFCLVCGSIGCRSVCDPTRTGASYRHAVRPGRSLRRAAQATRSPSRRRRQPSAASVSVSWPRPLAASPRRSSRRLVGRLVLAEQLGQVDLAARRVGDRGRAHHARSAPCRGARRRRSRRAGRPAGPAGRTRPGCMPKRWAW